MTPRLLHGGLALLIMATLVLEVSLLRLLMIAVGPNATPLCVALVSLGMGAATLVLFMAPGRFPRERLPLQAPSAALLLALATPLVLLVLLGVPLGQGLGMLSVRALLWGILPVVAGLGGLFFLGGLAVALILRHHAARIATLYAADLMGAALGTVLPLLLLGALSAESLALLATPLSALAAACLSQGRLRRVALGVALLGVGLVGANQQLLFLRVRHTFNGPIDRPVAPSARRLAVEWNPVTLTEILGPMDSPMYYKGISRHLDVSQHPYLAIRTEGAILEAPALRWGGQLGELEILTHDVSYLALHGLLEPRVVVLGCGGGLDALASARLGARSVLCVDHNPSLYRLINERFGDYTGRPFSHPAIRFLAEDARTAVQTLEQPVDLILMARVGFWRSPGQSGFILRENTLHTDEAYRLYLSRLSQGGVLSLVEYDARLFRMSFLRHTTQLIDALRADGARDVAAHLFIARNTRGPEEGLITTVAGRAPLSAAVLARLRERAARDGFDIYHDPARPAESVIAELLSPAGRQKIAAEGGFELDPPHDDRPFFENYLSLPAYARMLTSKAARQRMYDNTSLYHNFFVLTYLFVTTALVLVVAAAALLLPLWWRPGRRAAPGAAGADLAHGVYFAALGFGFFAFEIPLLSYLKLLLGSPLHSVTVVLCTLLLCAGLGSLLSERVPYSHRAWAGVLLAAVGVLAGVILTLPWLTRTFAGAPLGVRGGVVGLLLAPAGVVLGMPMPLGLRRLADAEPLKVAWAWGVNAFASVAGSLLSYALALRLGYQRTLLLSLLCYGVAFAVVLSLGRRADAALPDPT